MWHQVTAPPLESTFDLPGWGPWSRKAGVAYAHAPTRALSGIRALRVHMDASTSGNGLLRVLPGSHVAGVLTDEEVFVRTARHEAAECLVGRGGGVVMRPLLIHVSSRARTQAPRRVLHIEYAESLKLDPVIRLAVA